MISTRLVDWIVNTLHVDLNLGKLTWKRALVRKLPPLVRAEISDYLKSIGLGLDLRTKDEGRQAQDKPQHHVPSPPAKNIPGGDYE